MADFDKININGVPYNVKDTATSEKAEKLENDLKRTNATVAQHGIDIAELQKIKESPIKNVMDYGADNTGVQDSYPAFSKAASDATVYGYVFVPKGIYYISQPPTYNAAWLIASGTRFTGAGMGSPQTGAGLFPCTTISNPWLITSGPYMAFDLQGVQCPDGGAVNAYSMELRPQTENGRYWRNLLYLGADTGKSANPDQSTEILNAVENITGHKAIMMELDLNAYANTGNFSSAIFITGGGNIDTDMVAIDIQRDRTAPTWTNALSVKNSDNALYIESETVQNGIIFGSVDRKNRPGLAIQQAANGADGIVIRRNTDENQTGNLIVCWSADEQTELFAVGANGDIRCNSIMARTGSTLGISRIRVSTNTFSQGENTLDVTAQLNGKKILAVVEPSTIGFVSAITSITNVADRTFNYYLQTSGTGSVEFTILAT